MSAHVLALLSVAAATSSTATRVELVEQDHTIVRDIHITTSRTQNGVRGALTFTLAVDAPSVSFARVLVLTSVGDVLATGMTLDPASSAPLVAHLEHDVTWDRTLTQRLAAAARSAVLVLGGTLPRGRHGLTVPLTGYWLQVAPVPYGGAVDVRVELFFSARSDLVVTHGATELHRWLAGPVAASPTLPMCVTLFDPLVADVSP